MPALIQQSIIFSILEGSTAHTGMSPNIEGVSFDRPIYTVEPSNNTVRPIQWNPPVYQVQYQGYTVECSSISGLNSGTPEQSLNVW